MVDEEIGEEEAQALRVLLLSRDGESIASSGDLGATSSDDDGFEGILVRIVESDDGEEWIGLLPIGSPLQLEEDEASECEQGHDEAPGTSESEQHCKEDAESIPQQPELAPTPARASTGVVSALHHLPEAAREEMEFEMASLGVVVDHQQRGILLIEQVEVMEEEADNDGEESTGEAVLQATSSNNATAHARAQAAMWLRISQFWSSGRFRSVNNSSPSHSECGLAD